MEPGVHKCAKVGCPSLIDGDYLFCFKHRHFPGYYPVLQKPLAIDVVMVAGPPASGKSTFVEKNKKPDDIVLDLDVIKAELTRKPLYALCDKVTLRRAITVRNKVVESLQFIENTGKTLWFVISAPDVYDRQKWKSILKPKYVYVCKCTFEECRDRIKSRASETQFIQIRAANLWFLSYKPLSGETIIDTSVGANQK
jgi:hypothetical protein